MTVLAYQEIATHVRSYLLRRNPEW